MCAEKHQDEVSFTRSALHEVRISPKLFQIKIPESFSLFYILAVAAVQSSPLSQILGKHDSAVSLLKQINEPRYK